MVSTLSLQHDVCVPIPPPHPLLPPSQYCSSSPSYKQFDYLFLGFSALNCPGVLNCPKQFLHAPHHTGPLVADPVELIHLVDIVQLGLNLLAVHLSVHREKLVTNQNLRLGVGKIFFDDILVSGFPLGITVEFRGRDLVGVPSSSLPKHLIHHHPI